MALIDKIFLILGITVIILVVGGIFSLIIISHYEENIETAPCAYMRFSEKLGYGANVSEVWNRRVECGLINDLKKDLIYYNSGDDVKEVEDE